MPEAITADDLTSNAQEITKFLLDSLEADAAEVFGASAVIRTVQFTSTKIFGAVTREEAGFGIRYQKNGQAYFQSVDGLSLDRVKHILSSYSGMQALAYSQEAFEFASTKSRTEETSNYDTRIAELTLQNLFDTVQSITGAVAAHKSPFFISSGSLMAKEVQQTLVNTNGFEHQEKTTLIHLQEHLAAGDKEKTVFESNVSHTSRFLKDFDAGSITLGELDTANQYTKVSMLKGNRILPVIFSSRAMNQIGDNLLRHLLTARYLSASLDDSKTVKPPKISEKITMIEEAGALTRLGGHVFDHEGVPTKNLTLYKDGNPKRIPVDLLTASRSQETPTGSAYRGLPLSSDSNMHRRPPSIIITSIAIKSGNDGEDQLLAGVDKGLVIDGIAKVNYFDTSTGNFELSSTEAGQINEGEKGKGSGRITVYGNLFEMLSLVESVGKNVGPGCFSFIPALKVTRMRVLGKPKEGH
ncbi:MAG: metallopeptidase TldD-related protein [Candidatus Odinarchaeota archaeon]